jgi:hypothetical protein
MRKLLVILALLVPSLTWAGTCGNGYSFSREIKLHRAIGTDQTNYAFLLNLNYASIKTVANGGQVQNTANNALSRSGPADMVFCDASSAGNVLKYEVVTYSATAGTAEVWVEIPTLHTASNDSIWIFLNNVAVVTSQQDLSMWSDVSCTAIWHFPDGSSLDAKDSCPTNSLNGTINGTTTASNTLINGSANFAGAATSNITFDSTTNWANTGNPITVTWWGTPTFTNHYPNAIVLHSNDTGPWQVGWSDDCNLYCGVLFGNSANWAHANTRNVPSSLLMNYAGVSYNGSGSTANGNFTVVQNTDIQTLFTSNVFGAVTNENKIGSSSATGNAYAGKLDELRVFSNVKSTDWMKTDWFTGTSQSVNASSSYEWKVSPFIIVEPTYTDPTIRQYIGCSSDLFSNTCPMGFPYTSGNLLVVALAATDSSSACFFPPTDSLGLTFTSRVGSTFTGTLHSYQMCIWTAPITSSAIDTITISSSNTAAVVYELINVGTTSVATANTTNNNVPPDALSATSPGANSFLICASRDTGGPPAAPPTSSEGYAFYQGPPNTSTDHPSLAYAAYGIVGTGTQTCSLSSGNGAAMAIFSFAAPASGSVRHRVVNF